MLSQLFGQLSSKARASKNKSVKVKFVDVAAKVESCAPPGAVSYKTMEQMLFFRLRTVQPISSSFKFSLFTKAFRKAKAQVLAATSLFNSSMVKTNAYVL